MRQLPVGPGNRWLVLCAGMVSDVGRVRKVNEDNYFLDGQYNVDAVPHREQEAEIRAPTCIAVFDGMGGGEAGDVASRLAAESFRHATSLLEGGLSTEQIDQIMTEAFRKANAAIIEHQKTMAMYGTTGTVMVIFGRYGKVYHLGDSRLYLYRDGQLTQLTRDQTVAQMKIDSGFYKPDDERVKIESHQLTEFIGCDQSLRHIRPVESDWLKLRRSDILLLCSDGLYDMCSDEIIANIIGNGGEPLEIGKRLVNSALASGGVDNITCLAARLI